MLDLLVGHDESSDGLGEVDEEGGVSNVITGDLGGIRLDRFQVLFLAGSEDGESENGVSGHGGSVLGQHTIENTHVQLKIEDELGVSHQLGEFLLHSGFFPFMSSIEGDFFSMSDESGMTSSIISLVELLNSGVFTK